jgi:hypothetical protein
LRQGPEEMAASPTSQGAGNFEFMVEGEPARILTMIRGYFESDEWPYGEKSTVYGPDLAPTLSPCVTVPVFLRSTSTT